MAGRVFKRGETYHIAFYSNGTEYRMSAKTNKKREAENLLSFYLGKVARGEFQGFAQEDTSLSLTEVLADFEDACQERGLRGFDRIRSHLNQVRAYFGTLAACFGTSKGCLPAMINCVTSAPRSRITQLWRTLNP